MKTQSSLPFTLDFATFAPHSPGKVPFWQGSEFVAAPAYETDKAGKIRDWEGNFLFTPELNLPGYGAGQRLLQDLSFRWRPFVGFELGNATQHEPGYVPSMDYARFLFKLQGMLSITKAFDLNVEFDARAFLTRGPFENSDQRDFEYLLVSPTFWLDPLHKHLAIGLTYKNGKSTPKFQEENAISAFLGARF